MVPLLYFVRLVLEKLGEDTSEDNQVTYFSPSVMSSQESSPNHVNTSPASSPETGPSEHTHRPQGLRGSERRRGTGGGGGISQRSKIGRRGSSSNTPWKIKEKVPCQNKQISVGRFSVKKKAVVFRLAV